MPPLRRRCYRARVTISGIGGLFFRSKDPQARAAWYREHLGIDAGAEGADAIWMQEAGPTVFAPFAADSSRFPADQAFMLTFRVTDLTALIGRLEAAGIAVEQRAEWDTPYGRFVRIRDPEGLTIDLWGDADESATAE